MRLLMCAVMTRDREIRVLSFQGQASAAPGMPSSPVRLRLSSSCVLSSPLFPRLVPSLLRVLPSNARFQTTAANRPSSRGESSATSVEWSGVA